MKDMCYPNNEDNVISEKEMKIIRKEGIKVVVADGDHEVTSYLWKDRVFVDDIKKIEK